MQNHERKGSKRSVRQGKNDTPQIIDIVSNDASYQINKDLGTAIEEKENQGADELVDSNRDSVT